MANAQEGCDRCRPCNSKRAVLCGVSYLGIPQYRKTSLNNVMRMKSLLTQTLGFPEGSVRVLTEYEPESRVPTKENILAAMRWLVQGSKPGDSLVFYFSGHASKIPDQNGDEKDGFDEALWPSDWETEGKIRDDDINTILVRPLPHGARLNALIDTFSDGTLLDLPFVCSINQDGHYMWNNEGKRSAPYKGTSGGFAVSFNVADNQKSSGEIVVNTAKPISIITYSFVEALENENPSTYGEMLKAMRNKILEAEKMGLLGGQCAFSPEPELYSSKKFEIYSKQFNI